MDSTKTYPFNLPWRGVAIGTGFYAGLALLMARLAKTSVGAIYLCMMALSVIFGLLGFWLIIRRMLFPRVLALTNDAVLYPKGFPLTRIVEIRYADIIQMSEKEMEPYPTHLFLTTSSAHVEIACSRFLDITTYLTVRDFISSKASIAMTQHEDRRGGILVRWRTGPETILSWTEPAEWVRYRRAIYTSKSPFLRIGSILRFFVCCFGIIAFPWLLLILLKVPAAPPAVYLSLALAVTLFFTLVQWVSISHPVHSTKISLYERGLTQFLGNQALNVSYKHLSGWAFIEREGVLILLLRLSPKNIARGFAVPDLNIRAQLEKIFQDKNIPLSPELKPSWE